PPGLDEFVPPQRDGITPGAVVLLHDGGGDRGQTVDAVERVVPALAAQGWRFALPRRPDWP
ncbi:polysaccharide deacetylase family protein, partial [Micromonospora carbonacea]